MRTSSLLPILPLLLLAVLCLSWWDVLPGAWRLWGYAEDHDNRHMRGLAATVLERLDQFETEGQTAPPGSVVFIGSSTIERFPLAEAFPGRNCLNRGIGDEPAWSLVRRLGDSLPEASPAGLVFYVGSVDLRREGRDEGQVLEAAGRVLGSASAQLPEVPALVLGLLPARGATPHQVAALDRVNRGLRELAEEHGYDFLDTNRPPLRKEGGSLAEDMSVDRLHLSPRGYGHLTRWILEEGGAVGAVLNP